VVDERPADGPDDHDWTTTSTSARRWRPPVDGAWLSDHADVLVDLEVEATG